MNDLSVSAGASGFHDVGDTDPIGDTTGIPNPAEFLQSQPGGSELMTDTMTGDLKVAAAAGDQNSSIQPPDTGNLGEALLEIKNKDPQLYSKIITDGQNGDGNSLINDELQAKNEGDISTNDAISMVSGTQQYANDNGGGKINNSERQKVQSELGGNYVTGGKTRFEEATGL